MPGLFGVASLNPRARLEPGAASAALAAMAEALSRGPGTIIHRWVDPAGRVAVGRIGLEELLPSPMRGRDGSPHVFTYGAIHDHARLSAEVTAGRFDDDDMPLRSLRGSWVMLRCHTRTRRLMLAVDRRASIPRV